MKLITIIIKIYKKSENEILEILVKLKSWNLHKFKSKNLSRSKKIQNASTIEELNFLSFSIIIIFNELK